MPGRIVAREHDVQVVCAAIRAAAEVLSEKTTHTYTAESRGREIGTLAKHILLELEKPTNVPAY